MKIAIRDVRAVLRGTVLDGATVIAEDGVLVDVGISAAPPGALDGRGALLVPGLVDLHSDGLEREVSPRANVTFPLPFALRSFEGRVRAAGVTTVFHGVAFEDSSRYGRSIELAEESCEAIAGAQDGAIVDHRILHRLDARSPVGLDALLARLPERGASLVSLEDHTPGQGQFRDVSRYTAAVAERESIASTDAETLVLARIAARDELVEHTGRNRVALAELASAGRITLLAHDPEGTEDIDDAWRRGAAVAEFPLSVEAARAAHRKHMAVVMGAPNVLRGGSHSGNAAAEPLVKAGLCDVLASDYLPSSLLAAALGLADRKVVPLCEAIGLVTARPAAIAGLQDRGRIEVGLRADLALVDVTSGLPRVVQTWRADDAWPAGAIS